MTKHPQFLQDALAAVLAALVAWAVVQLSGPFGLPSALTLGAGVAAAAALLLWHARTRGTPAPAFLPFRVTASGLVLGTAIVTLLALALRLYTFLDRPAWADEMWTLRNFYTSDWGELFRVAFDDYWPPLHYVLLNLLARIGDTSLLTMRLPSVLFGAATVALMVPLGRELFGSRAAGLVAAALLAGMTSHVLYSQEARVYALQVMLAVISATTFYRSWRERRISPAFVVSTSLMTWSHSFASWYFIAGECAFVAVAWLLWRDGKAFWKAFQSQVLVLVLWLPLVGAFVYSRMAREIVVPTYWATGDNPGLFDIVEQYQSLAVRSWAGAAFLGLLFALAALLLLRGGRAEAEGAPGLDDAPAPPETMRAVVFLICWTTVPVLFSLVVTLATSLDTFGATRYHLAVVPGLCMLATAGLLAVRSRAGLAAAGALLVLLPASQLARHYREFGDDRTAMDQAAEIVREFGTGDEDIYVGNDFRAFAYYYRGSFPRIGSEEWDRMAATWADLGDVYTMESVKRGDTYAYEKFTPRIRYVGYYASAGPDRGRVFVEAERARGGFTGSYWLVLEDGGNPVFRAALDEAGIPCNEPRRWTVPRLEVIHCAAVSAP